MPPIKRNGSGSYEVNERFINWSAIILVLITGGGVGTFGVMQTSDRWTNVQAAEAHNILADADAAMTVRRNEIEKRVRENERELSELGGPNDPLAPRVDKLEQKIDNIQQTVNGNALALRELKTILRERRMSPR